MPRFIPRPSGLAPVSGQNGVHSRSFAESVLLPRFWFADISQRLLCGYTRWLRSEVITVAICTLNRAELLRRTLKSLALMELPDGLDWEVLVTNNHSTDHTDEVVASFADRLPIRCEFEPQRGLSRARNRAVDGARGDYIVWTDDDVIVEPGWIRAYAAAFQRWPEAAVFGGPIAPRYEAPVPKWFSEGGALLSSLVAATDFGDAVLQFCVPDHRLPYGRLPLGPNFAVRTAEQRAFRYNTELGLGPGQKRRGEELDVVERILKSGSVGYWVPDAKVEHCVSRGQLTTVYAAEYFATVGEERAFRKDPQPCAGVLWLGAPRWLWRRMIEEWLFYRFHRWRSPTPVWLRHLREYSYIRGTIRYFRSQRGSSRHT